MAIMRVIVATIPVPIYSYCSINISTLVIRSGVCIIVWGLGTGLAPRKSGYNPEFLARSHPWP